MKRSIVGIFLFASILLSDCLFAEVDITSTTLDTWISMAPVELFQQDVYGEDWSKVKIFILSALDEKRILPDRKKELTEMYERMVAIRFYKSPWDPEIDAKKMYESASFALVRGPSTASGLATNPYSILTGGLEKALLALSEMIAEQFKQEAGALYFESVKKRYLNPDSVICSLFQETTKLARENHPFEYLALGDKWRQYFSHDLGKLPVSIRSYVEWQAMAGNSSTWKRFVENKYFPFLYAGIDVLVALTQNETLDYKKLKEMYIEKSKKLNNPGFDKLVQIIDLLLLIKSGTIDDPVFQNLVAGEYIGKDFYSLKDKNIRLKVAISKFEIPLELAAILGSTNIYDELRPLIELLKDIEELRKNAKETEDYIQIMRKSIELFCVGLRILDQDHADCILEEKIIVLNNCLDLYQSVYKKEFFKVVSNVSDILRYFSAELVPNEARDKDLLGKLAFVQAFLKSFGNFMESIVNAKDGEQVKIALRRVLLPSLSSLEKRKTGFSVTLAAHPGVSGAIERPIKSKSPEEIIQAVSDEEKTPTVYNACFTAPVGIEFCKGFSQKKSPSFGIFLSIVDLGAYVSYRISKKSDEFEGFPGKFSINQIFSPGVSLNIGFSRSPITVRFGWQLTPLLRRLNDDEDSNTPANTANVVQLEPVKQLKTYRLFLGLSWDISLISITPRFKRITE